MLKAQLEEFLRDIQYKLNKTRYQISHAIFIYVSRQADSKRQSAYHFLRIFTQ